MIHLVTGMGLHYSLAFNSQQSSPYSETQPPTITVHPAHATVCVGGRAELECQAEGERLVYDWYKDGKQFRENQRHGKLIFDPVTPEHLGEYYCVVVNDVGRVESSCARLSDGE